MPLWSLIVSENRQLELLCWSNSDKNFTLKNHWHRDTLENVMLRYNKYDVISNNGQTYCRFSLKAREGNVFIGVCHSVHNLPHGYSVTAHPCYSAVGTYRTGMLSCSKIVPRENLKPASLRIGKRRRSCCSVLVSSDWRIQLHITTSSSTTTTTSDTTRDDRTICWWIYVWSPVLYP